MTTIQFQDLQTVINTLDEIAISESEPQATIALVGLVIAFGLEEVRYVISELSFLNTDE